MASKTRSSKKAAPKTKKKSADTTKMAQPSSLMNKKPKNQAQTFNLLIAALVFTVLAMGYMRFKYFLVPATVNGSPIFSWEYVKSLHQTSGTQVIDQLVVEKLIAQEAKNQKIEVSQAEMDAEYERLEAQFESVGGLEVFLSSQGLNKKDIDNQVKLNLKVSKIVASDISVSEEEVDEYYLENKDTFGDLSVEEAKIESANRVFDQKLQQQIGLWIQDLRAKGQVVINFPNASTQ